MGRTGRKRLQRKHRPHFKNLNADSSIVELSRWMAQNNWSNRSKLKLGYFLETGRGLYSTKSFKTNDILIEIPFELLITFVTLQNSENFNKFVKVSTEKFQIYDLIALYLVYEKHLGSVSFWHNYFKSLPEFDKNRITWLCNGVDRSLFDDEILWVFHQKRENFDTSWEHVTRLLRKQTICGHCKTLFSNFVTFDEYLWAYNIICTRSVYVDPRVVRGQSNGSLDHLLADDPNTALCPFLDMFNHSFGVSTTAELRKSADGLTFRLATNTNFAKYEQIFISYGNHSNKVLLAEYGFVLPMNVNDVILFSFDEILRILSLKIERAPYKFLHEHDLLKDLYVSLVGCSYNLQAVLYMFLHESESHWSVRIYSSDFTDEQRASMHKFLQILLENKLKDTESRLRGLTNGENFILNLYKDYLKCRGSFIKHILEIHKHRN